MAGGVQKFPQPQEAEGQPWGGVDKMKPIGKTRGQLLPSAPQENVSAGDPSRAVPLPAYLCLLCFTKMKSYPHDNTCRARCGSA